MYAGRAGNQQLTGNAPRVHRGPAPSQSPVSSSLILFVSWSKMAYFRLRLEVYIGTNG